MLWIWLQFVICAGLIYLVGSRLSLLGDAIAEKSNLGRTWIGVLLLGAATSLPELVTGVSAVVIVNAPNLAAGGIFGSNLFNLAILALIDMVYRKGQILRSAHIGHSLTASLGGMLIGIAAVTILVTSLLGGISLGPVGIATPLLIFLYFVSMRMLFRHEQNRNHLEHETANPLPVQYSYMSSVRAYGGFILAALAIMALGTWLSIIGDQIATITGWGQTFVGNMFLAAATSLPEVVVTIAAVRLAAVDLAVGNILGSNIFNIAILSVFDFFFLGDFWAQLSLAHVVAGLLGVVMSAVAVIGLTYRNGQDVQQRSLGWESVSLILLYIVAMWLLFLLRD